MARNLFKYTATTGYVPEIKEMPRIVRKNVILLPFNSCNYYKYIFKCIYAKLIGFSVQFY
jgi:hypothetical protein